LACASRAEQLVHARAPGFGGRIDPGPLRECGSLFREPPAEMLLEEHGPAHHEGVRGLPFSDDDREEVVEVRLPVALHRPRPVLLSGDRPPHVGERLDRASPDPDYRGVAPVDRGDHDRRLALARKSLVQERAVPRSERGLEDRDVVALGEVERMVAADVERSLDDRTREPNVSREAVELDLLGTDDQVDPPAGPLRARNVRRRFGVTTGRRRADDVPRSDEAGDPPEVAGGLEPEPVQPRDRIARKETHARLPGPADGGGVHAGFGPFPTPSTAFDDTLIEQTGGPGPGLTETLRSRYAELFRRPSFVSFLLAGALQFAAPSTAPVILLFRVAFAYPSDERATFGALALAL